MNVVIRRLAVVLCWMAAPALAADLPGSTLQVPGACASPDLAAQGSDDERLTSIRAYLMCLGEQNHSTESLSGALSRPAPGGADARTPGKARELRLDKREQPIGTRGAVAQ